ncbi:unnamed protein product [Prorocentrum cordatum]|uniref:Glutathione transferase n=1 Tax=Prorocentrum cordatum TaxID=2364126 RepID=A0ABN9U5B5_9DINO|nr:unnamed protein product [Polarella glacialis]
MSFCCRTLWHCHAMSWARVRSAHGLPHALATPSPVLLPCLAYFCPQPFVICAPGFNLCTWCCQFAGAAMSIVPPLAALAGAGIPKLILDVLPSLSPFKCLLGSVFLYNSPHMVMMYLKQKASKHMPNNTNPRGQTEELKKDKEVGETLQRAQAAHQNGLESFPVFAAGVMACFASGADRQTVGKIATAHLLSRAAFNVFYIALPPTDAVGVCRSLSWIASLLSSCQLIALAASKSGF